MRVAITADPFIPVPPDNYGGIERIIAFLAEGLSALGIEVMLVAHPASSIDVPLIKYNGQQSNLSAHISNINTIARLKRWKPDVIHSFSRMAYLLPFLRSATPKIMSYQREPTLSQIKTVVNIARKNSMAFTGCSNYITDKIKTIAPAHTVYNGVVLDKYNFIPSVADDAPLIFLGRIEPIKGTHITIDVALKTNRKLIIAGNVPDECREYFNQQIKPHLSEQIQYAGPVNDIQKNELLGKACALLMPIEWNEPFGIVMCEAMACGTPVIGFNRGAVPEVIKNNYSGFTCSTTKEMTNAVDQLNFIERKNVYEHCKINFGSEVIVNNYLTLYKSLVN